MWYCSALKPCAWTGKLTSRLALFLNITVGSHVGSWASMEANGSTICWKVGKCTNGFGTTSLGYNIHVVFGLEMFNCSPHLIFHTQNRTIFLSALELESNIGIISIIHCVNISICIMCITEMWGGKHSTAFCRHGQVFCLFSRLETSLGRLCWGRVSVQAGCLRKQLPLQPVAKHHLATVSLGSRHKSIKYHWFIN